MFFGHAGGNASPVRGGAPKGRRGAGTKGMLSYRHDSLPVRATPLSQPAAASSPLKGSLILRQKIVGALHEKVNWPKAKRGWPGPSAPTGVLPRTYIVGDDDHIVPLVEGISTAGQKKAPEQSSGALGYFSKVQVMLMMSRVTTSPDRVPVPSPRSGKDTAKAPSVRV